MKIKTLLKKKRIWIPLLVLAALLVGRLMLPGILKRGVTRTLNDLPGYRGEVAEVDVSVFSGDYILKEFTLRREGANREDPFLYFPQLRISVDWKTAIQGQVICRIVLQDPRMNYVFEDHYKSPNPNPEYADWEAALRKIVPFDINELQIHNGRAAFVEYQAEPTIDLNLSEIEMTATNLQNVSNPGEELPSELKARALSTGGGEFSLDGRMNLLRQIPDVDVTLELAGASAESFNDFARHYASVDFEGGTVGIFSELTIDDQQMDGYIKPVLTETQLVGEGDSFSDVLWEGLVGFFKFTLKNQSNDTLSTRIPLRGDLKDIQSPFVVSLWGIIRNAWIEAYDKEAG